MEKIILFTDLDGTLLDESTYSADSSLQALRDLQSMGIAVIFCSSKTRAEQQVIRSTLGVYDPFIVENGSAIIIPSGTALTNEPLSEDDSGSHSLVLGLPIQELHTILHDVVSTTGISYQSFHDLSDQQIAEITGLDLQAAQRARAREFSETIVTRFSDKDLERFIQACERRGLQCTFGGRFLSVTRQGATKGNAVRKLAHHYQAQFGNIITIGVGDSPNDTPMLEAVDFPYLVQRPTGQWTNITIDNICYIPAIGPLGFTEMVNDIKQRLVR